MARAMRGARRSSPYSRKMRISSLERRAVDDIGGAQALARRHAHVERSVLHEAEAARGIVELRRGDAEIEQDAVELEARLRPDRRKPPSAENGARKIATRGSAAKRASGLRDGRRITIETEQSAVRDELLQNRPCMSASAKSGIQVSATARMFNAASTCGSRTGV